MNGKRLYRDRENGKLLGVCAGLGDYFGIDPNLVRVGWVVFIFMSFFLGIVLYFGLGLLLDDKPYTPPAGSPLTGQDNRPQAIKTRLEQLGADMAALDTALVRLEAYVTSDAFALQRKIWQLKE